MTTSDSRVCIGQARQDRAATTFIFSGATSSEVLLGLLFSALKRPNIANVQRAEPEPLEMDSYNVERASL